MRAVTLHPAMGSRLGQIWRSGLSFVVAGDQGRPVSGADVIVWSQDGKFKTLKTDSDGTVFLPIDWSVPGSIPVKARVEFNNLALQKTISREQAEAGETVFFVFPVCFRQPFLTVPEAVALVAGAAVTGAGLYWKKEGIQLVGEVLIGAAAFTAIYRLSCL